MTAVEFLKQVMITQLEIELRLEQIAHLQSITTRTTTTLRSVASHTSRNTAQFESSIWKLPEQVWKLENAVSKFIEVRAQAVEVISAMQNDNERILIEYRYLCLFSWRKIAKLMNFSLDYVFSLHRQALKNFPLEQIKQ